MMTAPEDEVLELFTRRTVAPHCTVDLMPSRPATAVDIGARLRDMWNASIRGITAVERPGEFLPSQFVGGNLEAAGVILVKLGHPALWYLML
jgi:hypothetical protein